MPPIRWKVLAVAGLLSAPLAACSTMSGTLFPDKPAAPPAPATTNLPQAGTSFFAPVPVTPGQPSGSPQGERIAELRNRLVALEGEVSARNSTLSELRQRASGEGALYRIAKSEAASTAPPSAVAITRAQGALERFTLATNGLDGEMRVFAKGSAEANKLMNDAAAVRDGNDEDQRQLNLLRGEIGAVAGQLDRLVNEISSEWALQSAFLAKERAALVSFGAGTVTTPTAALPGTATTASAAMLATPAFVTIKFDRANVSYRDALAQAVSTAKRRKPDATFDVVGVTAGRTAASEATARAQEVANTLSTLGVDVAKIRIFNAAAASLQAPEVRIYAR